MDDEWGREERNGERLTGERMGLVVAAVLCFERERMMDGLGCRPQNVGKWSIVLRGAFHGVTVLRQRDSGLWLRRIVSWYPTQTRWTTACMMLRLSKFASVFHPMSQENAQTCSR